jgi:hypothetical protein
MRVVEGGAALFRGWEVFHGFWMRQGSIREEASGDRPVQWGPEARPPGLRLFADSDAQLRGIAPNCVCPIGSIKQDTIGLSSTAAVQGSGSLIRL